MFIIFYVHLVYVHRNNDWNPDDVEHIVGNDIEDNNCYWVEHDDGIDDDDDDYSLEYTYHRRHILHVETYNPSFHSRLLERNFKRFSFSLPTSY